MMIKKVALVTGGNKGIGKEIVRGLYEAGVKVYLGARNLERGRVAAKEIAAEIEIIQQDITDEASIDTAYEAINKNEKCLDILVNNAAMNLGAAASSQVTVQEMRTVFETNVFSIVGMTNRFLPLLKKAEHANIVNLSSDVASLQLQKESADLPLSYPSSKTAVNALTVHYASEFKNSHLHFNMIAPGFVDTDFNGHRGTKTPQEGAAAPLKYALDFSDHAPNGVYASSEGVIPF
ncbi:SDR family NAD(P)-dependent oxidoreductase [Listeria sp. PSOL-1]|uniref:SDR family NAD(P)-dependent oxidoreductase n=1 Tax=Listeria sp. PSOL-1 TaxID=1844999 RepID=UPI0013D652B8|nr:SDR family NAD(P)-dependent oxidoreductase [Listeria sp. PSOL-1]